MPELPEVETTRRGLIDALEGRRIVHVEARHPRTLRRQVRPRDFCDRLRGRLVCTLGRHGKFLIFDVEGDLSWVTHLGMSGRVSIAEPGEPEAAHTHVIARTDGGTEMRFVDPRTFGFSAVYTPEELAESSIALLGPDAWTALPPYPALQAKAAGRVVAIKSLLLDQRFVAGLGNIYADEVLFRAGVVGSRPAGQVTAEEMRTLRNAIKPVLGAGLRHGGTSLDDLAYLLPDGQAGQYLQRLAVYGRADEPCRRCGTPIVRTIIGGRSSFHCPGCQA